MLAPPSRRIQPRERRNSHGRGHGLTGGHEPRLGRIDMQKIAGDELTYPRHMRLQETTKKGVKRGWECYPDYWQCLSGL